jgi:hypothetical protein
MDRRVWTALSVLFLFLFPAPVRAWGRIGHEVVAKMAEERLTPHVRAALDDLLGPGIRLVDTAMWADYQHEVNGAGAWHSVNVPIREPRYNSQYCPSRGCVVSKIEEFRRVLITPGIPKIDRQRALKFLIHFLADLHQPLHVGDDNDRGGNLLQVRFFGEGSNLHRVWDYQIIEHHTKNVQVWLWDLTFQAKPRMVAEWSKGTPEDWATESLLLAKTVRCLPGSRTLMKPGARIGNDYCRMALPIIQRQLAKAAIRTAWVLNQIFGK